MIRTMSSTQPSLHENDLALARRIRSGDGAAFDELVDRFSHDLFSAAVSLLGRVADAEDLVQDTLLDAFRRIGSYEGRASLKTWLLRIVFYKGTKARAYRRIRRMKPIDAPGPDDDADRQLHSPHTAAAVESKVDVMDMLATLSTEHREVLVLRELQKMSYDEIAEVLSLPPGTVESRIFRARQELKKRFAGYLP
jgi:RNA polymerase sigma-70 factor (ECF subfamily)